MQSEFLGPSNGKFQMKKITTGVQSALTVAVIAATLLISTGAQAALPAAASTAITDAGVDMLAAVGAVIASMVAVWGLRKLGSKMGWM
jgi:hypothetical protein